MAIANWVARVRDWLSADDAGSAILLERRSASSAIKAFYLLLFIVTTWKVSNLIESECANLFLTNNWFAWLPTIFLWVFVVHMLRLYISLEHLEDPLTGLHQVYIRPLPSNCLRLVEQILRFFAIVLVSLKGFETIFKGDQSHLVTRLIDVHQDVIGLAEIFAYLTALYSAMLFWDIFMKEWGGKKWNETFLHVSLVGFVISLYFMFVIASTDKDNPIPPSNLEIMRFLMAALIIATLYSLWRDRKIVFETIRGVIASARRIFDGPYYGRPCDIVDNQYANVKTDATYHGKKCTSSSCTLSNKTQTVAIPQVTSR